jgi:hypothetical protein
LSVWIVSKTPGLVSLIGHGPNREDIRFSGTGRPRKRASAVRQDFVVVV